MRFRRYASRHPFRILLLSSIYLAGSQKMAVAKKHNISHYINIIITRHYGQVVWDDTVEIYYLRMRNQILPVSSVTVILFANHEE